MKKASPPPQNRDRKQMTGNDALAYMIFVEAPDNASINLTLPSLNNSKELFFFLLDVFMRGVILLFSSDGDASVALHTIDQAMFDVLKSKMEIAGVRCHLDIRPSAQCFVFPPINIEDLKRRPDDDPLEKFVLILHRRSDSVHFWFEIMRKIPPGSVNGWGPVSER